MNICVIGVGFIGLVDSLALCEKGFNVYGVDINLNIVKKLQNRKSPFFEKGIQKLLEKHLYKRFFVFSNIKEIEEHNIDVYVISVGTPFKNNKPDLSSLYEAGKNIQEKDKLIIVRSTVPVGETEKLKEKYDLKSVIFAPERIAAGNALEEIYKIPQIVGCENNIDFHNATRVFSGIAPSIIRCTTREAELSKLINNTGRDVFFSIGNLMNEVCQNYGESYEKIYDIATKDYFRGGNISKLGFCNSYCLSKEVFLLCNGLDKKLKKRLLKGRRENELLDKKVIKYLCKNIKKKESILVSGIAFKGDNTSDTRSSTGVKIVDTLRKKGYKVITHDFYADSDIGNIYKSNCDTLVILNNCVKYIYVDKKKLPRIVFDAYGMISKENTLENFLI